MDSEYIRKRANELLYKYSINTLDEKEIVETLIKFDEVDEKNIEYADKTLKLLEKYLLIKEKTKLAESDFDFLTKLAETLREQEIRKTDVSNPPLFRTKDINEQDIYFITRYALNEYLKAINKDSKSLETVVEISGGNSNELAKLIEIIKRNF